jgi:DNA-binding NarL/FixJ family response regulator
MEMDHTADGDLTRSQMEVYEAIAAGDGSDDEAAVDRLADLRLVDRVDGRQTARDPRVAAHTLLGAVRQELTAIAERIGRIPDLKALSDVYDASRMFGGTASELVHSKQLMNERIQHVIAEASSELLTVQPGNPVDRDPAVQRQGVSRDRELLARGGRVRYLYSAEALEHDSTAEYMAEFIAAGGEVRVSHQLPPRMVVVDRKHLFVGNSVVPSEPDAGWHVTDIASVAWAREVYNGAWDAATPWEQARAHAATAVSTPRQREILRRLELGDHQQQIAERTGWSDRVINRELAALRRDLGMRSTYQLMVWWARTEERDLP